MEKDNKMKNKRNFIIIGIIIVVIVGIICAIFVNKNKAINTDSNSNNNGVDNTQNNIFNSSKITWVRNENLKTDSNYSEEENTVKTTNVNTNSLTNITLGEFINKWTENSDTNFLSAYPLENMINPAEIRKNEMMWSTRDFYIKGVLPGFEMRFTAKHPDYLEENFLGASEKDINVSDFIITNIQLEGNMGYMNDKNKFSNAVDEYYTENNITRLSNYDQADTYYYADMDNLFGIIDPENKRTEDEIISQTVDSIEETFSYVYKDYYFSDELKEDLIKILNRMYYVSTDSETYKNEFLSIKWQNENTENKHEVYINTGNSGELIIR